MDKASTSGYPSIAAMEQHQEEGVDFLAVNSLYNAKDRPKRDNTWTWLYCVLAALTALWGIAAFVKADPLAGQYTNGFFYSSSTCDINSYQAANPTVVGEMDDTFVNSFSKSVSIWLPITAVLALGSSVVYVLLFRKAAQAMVMLTVVASLAMSYIFAIVALASGAIPFGIVLLVVAVIMSIFYFCIRSQLKMCARLLSVAGSGLNDNVGLVPAALGIKTCGLGIMIYLFAALICALNVGHVAKAGYLRMDTSSGAENAVCLDAYDNIVPCCQWVVKGWAGAYVFFSAVMLSWTSLLVLQIKLYTVADTIGQWYFAPQGSMTRRGSVRQALRHCLMSSFGTVAFASAILAIMDMLRSALRRAARENIFCAIINCFAQPILAMMEQFTRFSTITAAITGNALVDSARFTFDMLKRNFLQTYAVWWVPEMCLHVAAFLFALTWATIVFFGTFHMWGKKDDDMRYGIAAANAAVCFGCIFYVLIFVSNLLLDIVNTVYICYAMDKDSRTVTRPEFHAIYADVPNLTVGPVVENPDGAMMYGAPTQQQAPAQQTTYPAYTPQPVYMPQPMYAAQQATSYPPQQMSTYGYPPAQPQGSSFGGKGADNV